MKSVAITLDAERAEKLAKLSSATLGKIAHISVAGRILPVQQPKVSASKIAQALLNAAIDSAFENLPE